MSSVVTEKNDTRPAPPPAGWVLYDAACPFCTRQAGRFAGMLGRRGFALAPLQADWVRAQLALPEAELLREMRLLLHDGRIFGGADALVELARRIWWAWPLGAAAHLPGVRALLRAAYRWFAARRACAGGHCALERPVKNMNQEVVGR